MEMPELCHVGKGINRKLLRPISWQGKKYELLLYLISNVYQIPAERIAEMHLFVVVHFLQWIRRNLLITAFEFLLKLKSYGTIYI